MIDDKIARVKSLIQQREEIDAELAAIFGIAAQTKRGRPRKEGSVNGTNAAETTAGLPAGQLQSATGDGVK